MPTERIYERGESIGPYVVTRVLALGTAGVVYEAVPDRELRGDLLERGVRRVALKMARLDSIPEDRHERRLMFERLDREFKVLLGFSRSRGHPNVVRVFDFGVEEGVPYYVMELVEGPTLAEALETRPRMGQIAGVFGQLCGAVMYLHELGVCHRDIKPSNVMLRADTGEPVLIDFGLTLPLTGRRLTAPHDLVGTPAYVSPECAAHWLDPKKSRPYLAAPTDDVWALGIMFYEILTGDVPWKSSPERRERLMKEIQRAKVTHPCKVNPKVPRPFGDFTMQLLEKDPDKRPRTASQALFLAGEAGGDAGDVLTPVPARRGAGRRSTRRGGGRGGRGRGKLLTLQLTTTLAMLLATLGAGFVLGMVHRAVAEMWGHRRVEPQPLSSPVETATNPGTTNVPGLDGAPGPWPQSDASEGEHDWSKLEWNWLAGGVPLPRKPLPHQMRAPCPPQYVEMIQACWKEIQGINPDGTIASCPENTFEVPGKEGARCFMWVREAGSNSAKHLDGGTE